MTRREFIDSINSYGELMDFCYDNNCYIMEHVVDSDYRNEIIDNQLENWAHQDDWRTVLEYLQEEESRDGYDYYDADQSPLEPLNDDDFEYYKNDVLAWADDCELWDDDEDFDDDDGYFHTNQNIQNEEAEASPTPEEDISLSEMFVSVSSILNAKTEEKKVDDSELMSLINNV